jgi:hypothetical protein
MEQLERLNRVSASGKWMKKVVPTRKGKESQPLIQSKTMPLVLSSEIACFDNYLNSHL